jgi:hypothetical protein
MQRAPVFSDLPLRDARLGREGYEKAIFRSIVCTSAAV